MHTKQFPFPLTCKKCSRNNYIHTTSGVTYITDIAVGKLHGHDKPLLPKLKPEEAVKTLSHVSSSIPRNQPQLVTNVPITRGMGRAGLKRKVTGTNPFPKPKVIFQSPQIQRPTVHSLKLQSLKTQK